MYCNTCGNEINENAVVCPKCGCVTGKSNSVLKQDAPNTGFAVLGFFFPLIGLILWLIWRTETPLKAHSAGKGALIGVIVSAAITLFYVIIFGALIGSMAGVYYY